MRKTGLRIEKERGLEGGDEVFETTGETIGPIGNRETEGIFEESLVENRITWANYLAGKFRTVAG